MYSIIYLWQSRQAEGSLGWNLAEILPEIRKLEKFTLRRRPAWGSAVWTGSETTSFKNSLRKSIVESMANVNGVWGDNFIQKFTMYSFRLLKVWPTWTGSETTSFKNLLRKLIVESMANVNGVWGDNFIQKFTMYSLRSLRVWPTWTESEATTSFKNGQRERGLRRQLHSKIRYVQL